MMRKGPDISMRPGDEIAWIDEMVRETIALLGPVADEGACWITFSDGTQRCYRDLDPKGCDIIRRLSGLKVEFYKQRFCP